MSARKITSMARVIDIFSTEPLETCQQLLDAAQQLVKSRKARNTPEPRTRRQKVQTSDNLDRGEGLGGS